MTTLSHVRCALSGMPIVKGDSAYLLRTKPKYGTNQYLLDWGLSKGRYNGSLGIDDEEISGIVRPNTAMIQSDLLDALGAKHRIVDIDGKEASFATARTQVSELAGALHPIVHPNKIDSLHRVSHLLRDGDADINRIFQHYSNSHDYAVYLVHPELELLNSTYGKTKVADVESVLHDYLTHMLIADLMYCNGKQWPSEIQYDNGPSFPPYMALLAESLRLMKANHLLTDEHV